MCCLEGEYNKEEEKKKEVIKNEEEELNLEDLLRLQEQ